MRCDIVQYQRDMIGYPGIIRMALCLLIINAYWCLAKLDLFRVLYGGNFTRREGNNGTFFMTDSITSEATMVIKGESVASFFTRKNVDSGKHNPDTLYNLGNA